MEGTLDYVARSLIARNTQPKQFLKDLDKKNVERKNKERKNLIKYITKNKVLHITTIHNYGYFTEYAVAVTKKTHTFAHRNT